MGGGEPVKRGKAGRGKVATFRQGFASLKGGGRVRKAQQVRAFTWVVGARPGRRLKRCCERREGAKETCRSHKGRVVIQNNAITNGGGGPPKEPRGPKN